MTALVAALVAGPSPVAAADDGTGAGTRTSTSPLQSPASVQGPPPAPMVDPASTAAASEWIVLCTSFAPCKAAGYGNDGYDAVYQSSFWSQYGGHNCTNYVAYRMIRNGMSSTRPAGAYGYARDWGVGFASQTNDTPAVGSVAWWDTSFSASGHVAYVERVVSSSEIYVSEDNWGGDFRWRKVTRAGGRWPQGFIHLKDVTAPAPSSSTYRPVTTTRLLDTTSGLGAPVGRVAAGSEVSVLVGGRGSVPTSGVGTAMLNVTAVSPASSGFTTAYPSGVARPVARNLTFTAGVTTSSLVALKVGADGRVRLYSSASTYLVVDVLGWYPNGTSFASVTPKRVLDTRTGLGAPRARLAAGSQLDLTLAGVSVPSTGVAAVVLGVSSDAPAASGWLTTWPTGGSRPATTQVHVDAGRAATSLVTTRLGSGGRVTIATEATTDVMVDVLGWIPIGSDFTPLTPSRIVDTRTGLGGVSGRTPVRGTVRIPVRGRGGVPTTGVKAVLVTLTSVAPLQDGAFSAYPTGTANPWLASAAYQAGRTVVNSLVIPVGTDGSISVYSSGSTYVVIDVHAWIRS